MSCRRRRWQAKLPHNRVVRHRDGRVVPIPEPLCLGTDPEDYRWILEEYRNAGRPRPTPEEVIAFDPPRDWRATRAVLEEFYATGPPA